MRLAAASRSAAKPPRRGETNHPGSKGHPVTQKSLASKIFSLAVEKEPDPLKRGNLSQARISGEKQPAIAAKIPFVSIHKPKEIVAENSMQTVHATMIGSLFPRQQNQNTNVENVIKPSRRARSANGGTAGSMAIARAKSLPGC